MVRTLSTMLPLGTEAPMFSLSDTDGNVVQLGDFKDKKGLLVAFICNHCPYVKHVAAGLAKLGEDMMSQGFGVVAISSNDIAMHPDDSPEKMKAEKERRGYTFPYLYDKTQGIAKAYKAACTPDFFLFDAQHRLVYRGQMDDSRPGTDKPVTGHDIQQAVAAMLAGKPPVETQTPSLGCNIKWVSGAEPEYFPV